MAHDLLTVQRDPCAGVDALKLQPDLLRFSVISGGRKLRCIGAGAAPIIIATVLTVDVVPGMGQIDRDGFDTHGYLDNLKRDGDPHFAAMVEQYRGKYMLPV